MNTSKKHLGICFCVVSVGVVLGSAVTVAGRTEVRAPDRLLVSYTDLDVNTADGAAVLYHRIRVAAAHVCAVYDTRDLAHRALRQSCTERAVVEAVAQVDNPILSDRYLTHMTADAHPELVPPHSPE